MPYRTLNKRTSKMLVDGTRARRIFEQLERHGFAHDSLAKKTQLCRKENFAQLCEPDWHVFSASTRNSTLAVRFADASGRAGPSDIVSEWVVSASLSRADRRLALVVEAFGEKSHSMLSAGYGQRYYSADLYVIDDAAALKAAAKRLINTLSEVSQREDFIMGADSMPLRDELRQMHLRFQGIGFENTMKATLLRETGYVLSAWEMRVSDETSRLRGDGRLMEAMETVADKGD